MHREDKPDHKHPKQNPPWRFNKYPRPGKPWHQTATASVKLAKHRQNSSLGKKQQHLVFCHQCGHSH